MGSLDFRGVLVAGNDPTVLVFSCSIFLILLIFKNIFRMKKAFFDVKRNDTIKIVKMSNINGKKNKDSEQKW